MRLRLSLLLALALALSVAGASAAAFQMPTTFGRRSGSTSVVVGLTTGTSRKHNRNNNRNRNLAVQRFMSSEDKDVCAMPPDVDATTDFMSQKGSGNILRSAMLTNAAGELVSLGDSMGTGTGSSLVIFLRHLG
jgi:hypothetical protein